jgi:hypothetical protein
MTLLVYLPSGREQEFRNVSDLAVADGFTTFSHQPDPSGRGKLKKVRTTFPILVEEDAG